MLHCKFCKVDVAGSHEHCPLCGGNLTGEPDAERTYPPAPPKSDFAKRFLQIATVVAACAGVICVAVNLLVTPQVWWSLYTLLGIACGWLWLTIGLLKKSNIKKSIAWQLIVISLLVLLWDAVTGWHGWSIDLVFPSIYTCALLAVMVLTRILHMPVRDYIIYAIMGAVLGVIPVIFILTGILHVLIPSVICVAVSLIVIVMLLLFHWKAVHGEIVKKLHL